MTMVSLIRSVWIMCRANLIYTVLLVKWPHIVSFSFFVICFIFLHDLLAELLTMFNITQYFSVLIIEIGDKFAPNVVNQCSYG